jgi:serine/threonine protein kinase
MGKIYRATQLSTNKTVAIKALPRSRQADINAVEKFLQEAQILGHLRHPNIVGVQGVGRFPGGGYFFAMDYIDGADLQSQIEKQPLPIEEALSVVRTVSRAVAYVHEQGVIHGDLKPANVLVDREGQVFVTDFGLAQFSSLKPDQQPWIVGGTAGYVAPEVRVGGRLPTEQSDVFGLGALLWALVTGEVPRAPLIAPRNAEVPEAILAVCGRCLEDNPHERFRGVRELVARLESLESAMEGSSIRRA